MGRTTATLALVAASLAAPGAAHNASELGIVDFPITCAEPARAGFARGVALLHSFGYEDARKALPSPSPTSAVSPGGAAP